MTESKISEAAQKLNPGDRTIIEDTHFKLVLSKFGHISLRFKVCTCCIHPHKPELREQFLTKNAFAIHSLMLEGAAIGILISQWMEGKEKGKDEYGI